MSGRLAAGIAASLAGHVALAGLAFLAPLVPGLFPAPPPSSQAAIAFEVVRLPAPEAARSEEPSGGARAAVLRPVQPGRQQHRLATRTMAALVAARPPESALAALLDRPGGGGLDGLEHVPASPGADLLAAGLAGAGTGGGALPGADAERPGAGGGPGGAELVTGGGAMADGRGAGGGGRLTGTGSGSGSGSYAAVMARLRARAAPCYPRAAQRREVEGIATVRFCVDAAGSPTGVKLLRSSGSSALDAAAVECVVKGAAPLPQPPAAEPCMSVPVLFRLR